MSLSDKIKHTEPSSIPVIQVKDVKEFIQKILEEAKLHTNPTCMDGLTWTEFIDKEAGEKLI